MTANVQDRQWFFVTPKRAAVIGQTVQTCCQMKNFDLLAYCILPNHIHILVRKSSLQKPSQRTRGRVRCGFWCGTENECPEDVFLYAHRRRPRRRCGHEHQYTLSNLMHSIKSTFSHSLHRGKFWQHRSNFRIVETEEYLSNAIEYIRFNYHKMNLHERYGKAPFVFIDWQAIERALNGTTHAGEYAL